MFLIILAVIVSICVVVLIADKIWRGRSARAIIKSPRLGILNLKGPEASQLVGADKAALGSFFTSVEEGTNPTPVCDVLFVYCDLTDDGRVMGSALGIREIIRDAGAAVVVVASENTAENYIASTKRTAYGRANLVMTLDRKDEAFRMFYRRLFGLMADGVSMPNAWVQLAPQVPGQTHRECPEQIFACEAGQISFAAPLFGSR